MNNTFNSDLESDQSTDSDHKDSRDREARYLEFIELLIDKSIERLKRRTYRPKIQDALRAIRLKQKVFKDSEAEKSFWDMIEEVRQEELPKLYPESKPEPIDLESQIINTIKELEYQVTNGTLPVKTITDYFNYGKPDKSRLSYSRLGRILSALGFRKARTSNNCSAIFWDDQLLSDISLGVQKLASANPANGGASAHSSPEVQPECRSLLERSGNPANGGTSAPAIGGASADSSPAVQSECASLLERSGNPANGGTSAPAKGGASADSSPAVQSECASLLERSGNPAIGGTSAPAKGGASAHSSPAVQSECASLLERGENPANGVNRIAHTNGGASADDETSQAAPESCLTDPTEHRYTLPPPSNLPKGIDTSGSNSSVSNVCNSLPDNDLEEK